MKCETCDGTGVRPGNYAAAPGDAPDILPCTACAGEGHLYAVVLALGSSAGHMVLNAKGQWTPVLNFAAWHRKPWAKLLAGRTPRATVTTDVQQYATGRR